MAVKTFTDNTALPASDINTYLANSGLVYITSATVTAAATAYIDGCFTSTYDNYTVTWETTDQSGTGSFQFRLRTGGTASAANYYYSGFQYYFTAAAGAEQGNNVNQVLFSAATTSGKTYSVLQLNDPYVAKQTNYIFDYVSAYSNYAGGSVRGQHTPATSYDGFQINMNTGATMTGVLRVYGWRQA
jgi:hypothetical protein